MLKYDISNSFQNKLNIQEQLPKYLGDVKLLTTPCVIVETERLGKGSLMPIKRFLDIPNKNLVTK